MGYELNEKDSLKLFEECKYDFSVAVKTI